ncbi:phosphopantetheine-binding protein [Streptomyces zagrosensis]|uniref:Acyl carrier protein n=1 Tax=Streptomyces zagrosensis TaxID=1042984 RepID=A0A7W9QAK1_9ACTN|nr:phosphopantetheine-binding protein [Streptomyces zagrosensis]MBB5936683.1 acyl carrier protein [Streptomyces zagrosensis]
MSEDVRATIRDFITGNFPDLALKDDEDIFELGFVNSLFAMQLVMFIEKTFSLRVPNQELRLDSFRTIDSMAKLVERLSSDAQISTG